MAKKQTNFVCQQCGYVSPSFLGRCPSCDSWNSLVETLQLRSGQAASHNVHDSPVNPRSINDAKMVRLSDVRSEQILRFSTGLAELDRVLGGGIVPGMAVLVAGEPGIGKSTLLLELCRNWSNLVLYVAGEESASQIRLRAERLNVVTKKAFVLESTDVDTIIGVIKNLQLTVDSSHLKATKDRSQIGLVIVDSIQTMTTNDLVGPAGSVGQVRECAARLIKITKEISLPLFLVGHVTKEGAIAGPKVLEHIVDTILTVEGDRFEGLRIVRTTKNRFGPTDEVGIFTMTDSGLKETDVNSLLGDLKIDKEGSPGSCLTVTMEGTRPMVVEIQALVTSTPLPSPRRVASGVDYNRLLTVIAILQKRLNLPLYKEDVYVSVFSGIKISEPAADLAMALSILSSYRGKALAGHVVAIGELDLLGNVRKVNKLERRIKEAKVMGLKEVIEPSKLKNLAVFKL